LSVAFDADLPCKGDFSEEIERWRLKVGDNPVHQNIPGLQSTQTCTQRPLSEYSYYFYIVDCSVFYKRSFSALRRPKTRVRSTMGLYPVQHFPDGPDAQHVALVLSLPLIVPQFCLLY
jgi:hypothetical protein